jgi:hypothetical protein
MTDDFYKQAFEAALEELSDLEKERETLKTKMEATEERMEKVRQAALGLLSLSGVDFQVIKDKYPNLFDNQLDPRIGITEAIRQVLKSSEDMLTTYEIRDLVFQISPTIAGHKNPIATVSSILRRLMDNDEVTSGIFKDGKTVYGWIASEDAEERLKRWFKQDGKEIWERVKARRAKKAEV